jgi:hypothetical protein
MLYVIIADNEFDQICETEKDAIREKRDLKRMGCEVTIKKVADWKEADELEERMQSR